MDDGSKIEDEIAFADAHSYGARPFGRDDYIAKFQTRAADHAVSTERDRFLAAALALPTMRAGALSELTVEVPAGARSCEGLRTGLFEQSAK
jgi:2-methylcitrate dehydratase